MKEIDIDDCVWDLQTGDPVIPKGYKLSEHSKNPELLNAFKNRFNREHIQNKSINSETKNINDRNSNKNDNSSLELIANMVALDSLGII